MTMVVFSSFVGSVKSEGRLNYLYRKRRAAQGFSGTSIPPSCVVRQQREYEEEEAAADPFPDALASSCQNSYGSNA